MQIAPCPALERRVQQYWCLAGVVALLLVALETAALAGLTYSPTADGLSRLTRDPFNVSAIASAVLFLFFARLPSRQLLGTVAVGIGVSVALLILGGETMTLLTAGGLGLGLTSLAALGRRAVVTRGQERTKTLALFLPAALVPTFTVLNVYFLHLTADLCPVTYDANVLAADEALGAQLSYAVGHLFGRAPGLAMAALIVYDTLPIAFLGLFLWQATAPRLPQGSLFWGFLTVGAAGYAVYLLVPVVGPRFAFPGFPQSMPGVHAALADPPAAPWYAYRNCMPSLHAAWALLIFWHARAYGRWITAGAGAFLALTLLATLGFGLHYAFDLIVAVPFTLAVRAALTPGGCRRARVVLAAVMLTGAWLGVILNEPTVLLIHPPLTVGAVLLTVGGCVVVERRLYRLADVVDVGSSSELEIVLPPMPAAPALVPVRHNWR